MNLARIRRRRFLPLLFFWLAVPRGVTDDFVTPVTSMVVTRHNNWEPGCDKFR